MNRQNWKFSYTADNLFHAALSKKNHHGERLAWWLSKQDETKEKIKSEGIEIDESVAVDLQLRSGTASNNFSTYRGPVATIRNDLLEDLAECVGKADEHRGKVRDYAAWAQVLESQGKASLDLNHDDWLFFFGK